MAPKRRAARFRRAARSRGWAGPLPYHLDCQVERPIERLNLDKVRIQGAGESMDIWQVAVRGAITCFLAIALKRGAKGGPS